MTFTSQSAANLFSSTQAANPIQATTAAFQRLSTDDQLAALWYIYTEIGRSITPAAPGAARLQLAEGILNQIRQMAPPEQLQVMRDLVNRVNTPISRAYGVLSANTKLGFWFQLAEWMKDGSVIPVPANYQKSGDVSQMILTLQNLEFNQQITVLRNAVVNMGVDPLG